MIGLIIIIFFVCQTTALVIPTEGLVAYYSFDDGTATDNSDNGFNGTINGATVTKGISGEALHFEVWKSVTLPNLFPDPNPRQVTLSAFVNLTQNRPECFVATGNPDITLGHGSDGFVGTGAKFTLEEWYSVTSSSTVPLHEWVLLTGVINKDTNEIKIFINGVWNGTSYLPDSGYDHPGLPSMIGAHPYMGGNSFTIGDIDEVLIYNRSLSDAEILQIYNAGINNAPTAQDDVYVMDQDTVLSIPTPGVLENDDDPDGDSLTASVVSYPLNGDLLLNSDGSFTYTPLPGWFGNVSFTYKANDGTIDSNVGTVKLTVLKGVIPLPGNVNPPTDPDGDGLYEDMNGNGSIGFGDVVLFFQFIEWIKANEPVSSFDFSGNGVIGFQDVVVFFNQTG